MHPFQYVRPRALDDAVAALAPDASVALGGGTDLLPRWKEGLTAPDTVVDLTEALPATVTDTGDALVIGAAARLEQIASDALVQSLAGVLAQACAAVGTPALRAMGTLGGNLLQRPRCWYWRSGHACAKSGGTGCPAVQGEHQYHAIVEAGPCWAVHPSDPAVALVALDAVAVVVGSSGTRLVPLAELYGTSAEDPTREARLAHGEVLVEVRIPRAVLGGRQSYTKLMQRGAWDFALVSLAAVQHASGDVRLVLGGVGPRPWRVNASIEEDVASGGLDDDSIDALAERALYDATPLPGTAYKVTQARGLLVSAMRALGGSAR
jgi:xanthine dehydrogenase YagS FAD-binding subunit